MTSNERRNALLEILSMRRFETLENLAFEFGVSKRTIRYDIEILSLTYPIYTVQWQWRRYSCRRKLQARKILS